MVRVLFVCLGNICRSPTAEGVFRGLATSRGFAGRIDVDSAGTGAWHIGKPPDPRAQAAARRRGIDLSTQRARQVAAGDFHTFDYLLAMDRENLGALRDACPAGLQGKLHLFLDFAPAAPRREVPDPYYGAGEGFDEVLDLVAAASAGLLDHICEQHFGPR